MPIFVYVCPEGHETEFVKLSSNEEEPKTCEHSVTHRQSRTDKLESFTCGLPLVKKIAPVPFTYRKGKNPNWPLE